MMNPSQTYLKFTSTLNYAAYCFVASAYASVQPFGPELTAEGGVSVQSSVFRFEPTTLNLSTDTS